MSGEISNAIECITTEAQTGQHQLTVSVSGRDCVYMRIADSRDSQYQVAAEGQPFSRAPRPSSQLFNGRPKKRPRSERCAIKTATCWLGVRMEYCTITAIPRSNRAYART